MIIIIVIISIIIIISILIIIMYDHGARFLRLIMSISHALLLDVNEEAKAWLLFCFLSMKNKKVNRRFDVSNIILKIEVVYANVKVVTRE